MTRPRLVVVGNGMASLKLLEELQAASHPFGACRSLPTTVCCCGSSATFHASCKMTGVP